jgi:hypothetical protein
VIFVRRLKMEIIKEEDGSIKILETKELTRTKNIKELILYLNKEKEKKEHELRMIQEYIRYFDAQR